MRQRHRIRSVVEMESFLSKVNETDGLEYSYAEKCLVLREQIQLRKQMDGVKKIGEVHLHNCGDTKKHPEPLEKLMEFFALICSREAAHGIPPPVRPQLLDGRSSKPGDDSLATVLLKNQHKEAAALTHAFYSTYTVNDPGEFTAYKMCRTYVPNPKSYVGAKVKRVFPETGESYSGVIEEYYDPKQFWVVKYDDGDTEDWSVPDMKKRHPGFKCGPVVNGTYEHTAVAVREQTRNRRRQGRRNPVAEVMQDILPLLTEAESGAEFELPDRYKESAGTVWKLLKVAIEDDGLRWGAYIAADEAAGVDPDDIQNLTLDELQDSYQVTLALMEDIESWIQSSGALQVAVAQNPKARASTRAKKKKQKTPRLAVVGRSTVTLPGTYQVDYIVCGPNEKGEYWVKWKGYASSKNTWEPKKNLPNHLRLEYNMKRFNAEDSD